MGYYVQVDIFNLKKQSSEQVIDDTYYLNDMYVENESGIDLEEYWFNWDDAIIFDLLKMAKKGVEGIVEMCGELGEHTRYVLEDGEVKEYYGETVYPKEPSNIYAEERKEVVE